MPRIDIQQILIRMLVLTLSLSTHEYAHARMAYHLGDDTAERQGRLTLNPMKHLDPLGALAFIIAGFGWARPVPVNPVRFNRNKVKNMRTGMMRVALAGPVSNLIIAFIANLIYQIIRFVLIAFKVTANTGLAGMIDILFLILLTFYVSNISLALFNMLPIPPLDGSRVLGGFLSDRAYQKYMSIQQYSMIILFALIVFGRGIIGRLIGYAAIPIDYVLRVPVESLFNALSKAVLG
ncbi:MAG TPA: site-2 protease family protein [Clostridiaceae bacterium]|jgi:Zn-dependent protease|nr:site-2 protease family protein [Clostridiaceae bacterium]